MEPSTGAQHASNCNLDPEAEAGLPDRARGVRLAVRLPILSVAVEALPRRRRAPRNAPAPGGALAASPTSLRFWVP
jgi:hypothetical protein